jgi:tetratricopeptide (TPR) repeat protein
VEALCGLGRTEQAEQLLDVVLLAVPEKSIASNQVLVSWGVDGSSPFDACDAPRVVKLLNIAIVKSFQNRLDEAETQLAGIVESYPNFFPAVRCLAYVYLRQKKVENALQLLAGYNTFPCCRDMKSSY